MEKSPVIQIIDLVWKHSLKANGHSWRRLNSALFDTVMIAIVSGMKFERDDFSYIAKNYRFGYWSGEDSGERFYSAAIEERNLTAAIAFERMIGRKPFLFGKPKKRLHIYKQFRWKGERVTVTSFLGCGTYLVACSYKSREKRTDPTKINHRYKLTRNDLHQETEHLKRRELAHRYYCKSRRFCEWVMDLCRVSYPKLSLDELERKFVDIITR